MTTQSDLLCKGYFPAELPPPFTTDSFAESERQRFNQGSASSNKFELCTHNAARSGRLRRVFGLPNPKAHAALCGAVEKNWAVLERCWESNCFSLSRPVIGRRRAVVPQHRIADLAAKRIALRAASRFLIKTDISQFYSSLYVHTISWALHTRPVAKARRYDKKLEGNLLDQAYRLGQSDQTIGIPIGPDTSLVFAETVLNEVDKALGKHLKRPCAGFRYVDDFEIAVGSLNEAETVLGLLQEKLEEVQLVLNPRKTTITELPYPTEQPWVAEFRRIDIRQTVRGQAVSLVTLFDLAFRLANQYPDEHLLSYVVGWLLNGAVYRENWPQLQALLLQASVCEPGVLPKVAGLLTRYHQQGYEVDRDLVQDALHAIVNRHAPLGHGSEVAWALWIAITFSLDMRTVEVPIAGMSDSVVALLALDAQSRGLVTASVVNENWLSHLTTEGLYDRHWLLAYEAAKKGWLDRVDHVRQDGYFFEMYQQNVSFYTKFDDPLEAPLRGPNLKRILASDFEDTLGHAPGGYRHEDD